MQDKTTEPAIEDLVDFFKHWPKLRPRAVKLSQNDCLGDKDASILDWMIRVVDRVSPVDLEEESRNV